MKIYLYLIFFLLQSIEAATFDQNWCEPTIDLEDEMSPPRGQESSPWCATFVATSLIENFHFKQTGKKLHFSLVEANSLNSTKAEPFVDLNSGASAFEILEGIQRKESLCLEKHAPFNSELYSLKNGNYDNLLKELSNIYNSSQKTDQIVSDTCTNTDEELLSKFGLPSKNEIKKIALESTSFSNLFSNITINHITPSVIPDSCKNTREKIEPFSIITLQKADNELLLKPISRELNNRNPLQTTLCFFKLEKIKPNNASQEMIDNCGLHSMIIIGKRKDPQTGKCQLKLQNSHDSADAFKWYNVEDYLASLEDSKLKSLKSIFWLTKAKNNYENKIYFGNGDIYIGKTFRGLFNGSGKYFFNNGSTYSGAWKNNKNHGYGTLTKKNGTTFMGNWDENFMNGDFEISWAHGSKFSGIYKTEKNGKIFADGTFISSVGNTYVGKMQDNKYHDKNATYTDISGRTFKGPWVEGKRNGIFTVKLGDGMIYKGTIFEDENGTLSGSGIATKDDISYTAKWENGLFKKTIPGEEYIVGKSKLFLKQQILKLDEIMKNLLFATSE